MFVKYAQYNTRIVGMSPQRRQEEDEIFGTIELSIRWPGGNCERRGEGDEPRRTSRRELMGKKKREVKACGRA